MRMKQPTETLSTKQSRLQFFRFVSEVQCRKEIFSVNANKPPGLSDLTVWALKRDAIKSYHITFLINEYVKLILFPAILKKRLLPPINKKGTEIAETNLNNKCIVQSF